MPIFIPAPLEGFELCQPTTTEDFRRIMSLIDGTSRGHAWVPIGMKLVREYERIRYAESDAPWFGSDALIFRQRALEALEPLLSQHGELLPLSCPDAHVVMYNPTHVIDALDERASSVVRLPGGTIVNIREHVFRTEPAAEIFKIPNLRPSPTYVRQRFVDVWKSAGLRGLEFKQVWPHPLRTSGARHS